MIKYFKIFLMISLLSLVNACSEILQTIDLKVENADREAQEEFNVLKTTLTSSEAIIQNKTPYLRSVIQSGHNDTAKPIAENEALLSNFPTKPNLYEYTIGIGDEITFSKLVDNRANGRIEETKWPPVVKKEAYELGIGDELTLSRIVEEYTVTDPSNQPSEGNSRNFTTSSVAQKVIESQGRVGSDGSVLMLEVGRIDAAGKTLNTLRSEVRNILLRNGASPSFQLEISEFRSKRAYLTLNSESSFFELDDQETDLKDLLAEAGVGLKPGIITRVKLQRNGNNFNINLRSIFEKNAPRILIQNRDHIFVEDRSSVKIIEKSTVGPDGAIVIESIGKVRVADRSLEAVRNEISSRLDELPDSENAFQLEITKFRSKSALVNIPEQVGGIVSITDRPLLLLEYLTNQGVSKNGNSITRINLSRDGQKYSFTFDALLKNAENSVILQHNDHVTVEVLPYKKEKVFIIGGITPIIMNIDPAQRQSLADILFTSGGVLESANAKRSEIYLLRGNDPVKAFHLDAQSPTRLIVADALELRPNDILYVAEQPIASFNRTLGTLVPLRILLRDIQDNNIP